MTAVHSSARGAHPRPVMSTSLTQRVDRETLSAGATGALGGLLATLTMTVYRAPIARSLPPTEEFWKRYGPGEGDDETPVVALLLHLAYGVGAGTVFGAAFAAMASGEESEARREVRSALLSVLYGGVLSLFGEHVVLKRLLAMDLAADEALVFHGGHLVYAFTLGTWVGSRTDD